MKPLFITSKSALQAILLTLVTVSTYAEQRLPYYNSAEFTPHWLEPDSAALEGFHRIPDFSFTDQNGRQIDQSSVANKIYVANFFFTTCPGICPAIRSKLHKVQDAYQNDELVKIVSHSIRPTFDTAEILQDYAKRNGIISDAWHLLTGAQDEIYRLAKEAYFASEDLGEIQNTDDFLHTENVLLIDQNRHIRGVYNGLNTASMNYLLTDIETLKAEIANL